MFDHKSKCYDLKKYPEDVRPIIAVLLKHEDALSDGYAYYIPRYWSNEVGELVEVDSRTYLELIAREILRAAR